MDLNLRLDQILREPLPGVTWESIIPMVGEGLMLELGVYNAGSFVPICNLAHPRKVYGFDWFWGLPDDWEIPNSKGAASMEGKVPNCPENGEFVIGLVEATLPKFLKEHPEPVGFVHFDLDLYAGTKFGLEHLTPRFRFGTILAFDEIDAGERGNGYRLRNLKHEQKAFREWLKDAPFHFEMIGKRHAESWVMRLL